MGLLSSSSGATDSARLDSESPRMQHPAAECAADQVLRLEPRHGGLLPHGPHFAGHAGEGQHGEARLRRPDDSWSCTGGVGQHLSPLRQ